MNEFSFRRETSIPKCAVLGAFLFAITFIAIVFGGLVVLI